MTISEAITRVDSLMHNTYSNTDKITWLSKLDAMITRLIIETHEGGEDAYFSGYDDETYMDLELLVPTPFDEIYLRWLEAHIHYANGEYDKYNNAILMYQAAYDAYANYYNRTYMPRGTAMKYF